MLRPDRLIAAACLVLSMAASACGPRKIDMERRHGPGNGSIDQGDLGDPHTNPEDADIHVFVDRTDSGSLANRMAFSLSVFSRASGDSHVPVVLLNGETKKVTAPKENVDLGTYTCLIPSSETTLGECRQLEIRFDRLLKDDRGNDLAYTADLRILVDLADGCALVGRWKPESEPVIWGLGRQTRITVFVAGTETRRLHWKFEPAPSLPGPFSDRLENLSLGSRAKASLTHSVAVKLPSHDPDGRVVEYQFVTRLITEADSETFLPMIANYLTPSNGMISELRFDLKCPAAPR